MKHFLFALFFWLIFPSIGNSALSEIKINVTPTHHGRLNIELRNDSEEYYFQTLRVFLPWSLSGFGMQFYLMDAKPPFQIFKLAYTMGSHNDEITIYPGELMAGSFDILHAFQDPKIELHERINEALKETSIYVFWFYSVFDLNSDKRDSRSGIVLLPRLAPSESD